MHILKILTEKRKIGDIGERAAARYLRKNGYRVIRRNYEALGYEIDLIAENREVVAFIEVKTRTVSEDGNSLERRPAASVTPEKQGKIILAAKWFRGEYRKERMMRFDIIEVYLDKNKKVQKIMHLESAFNGNTAKTAVPRVSH